MSSVTAAASDSTSLSPLPGYFRQEEGSQSVLKWAEEYQRAGNFPLAIHYYLLVAEEYSTHYHAPAVRQIDTAEEIARSQKDPLFFANFLQRLDPKLLIDLSLRRLGEHRAEIRKVCTQRLEMMQAGERQPTCFICFNIEDLDVKQFVADVLIPDLKKAGINPIFSPMHLMIGHDLSEFEQRVTKEDYVLVMLTPQFKRKCEGNPGSGVAREVSLMQGLPTNRVIPVFFRGGREESRPSFLLETQFSSKLTPYNYFTHLFRLVSALHGKIEHETGENEKCIAEVAQSLMIRDPLLLADRLLPPSIVKQIDRGRLPQANRHYVTRKGVALQEALKSNQIVVLSQRRDVINQTGKTEIALHFARMTEHCDKIIWIDHDGSIDKDTFSYPKSLVILDGFNGPLPNYPMSASCKILITSRNDQWEKAFVIHVSPFNEEEALELLQEISGQYDDEQEARSLVQAVGYDPRQVFDMACEIEGTQRKIAHFAKDWKKRRQAEEDTLERTQRLWSEAGLTKAQIDECLREGKAKWRIYLYPRIKEKESQRNLCNRSFLIPLFEWLDEKKQLIEEAEKFLSEQIGVPQEEAGEVVLIALSILKKFFPISHDEKQITIERITK